MATYKVLAKPWEHGFELHITGPDNFTGCTQSLSSGDILPMARDYVSINTGEPPDKIGIMLKYELADPDN
jgi:hypothetical protein